MQDTTAFTEHEKAIAILDLAQKELEDSGYSVEFTKTLVMTEQRPENAYFTFKMSFIAADAGPIKLPGHGET
jgi:hypothetical protein